MGVIAVRTVLVLTALHGHLIVGLAKKCAAVVGFKQIIIVCSDSAQSSCTKYIYRAMELEVMIVKTVFIIIVLHLCNCHTLQYSKIISWMKSSEERSSHAL